MSFSNAQKFPYFRSLIQLILLGSGIASTFFASWVFYLHPWLKLAADFDPWLERNRCLVQSWCDAKLLIAPPLGVLFLVGAFCAFTLAMWLEFRMSTAWKTAIDQRQMRFFKITLAAVTLCAVGFQIYQLLYKGTAPADITWLIGIGALLALGIVIDTQQPLRLQQTAADLLIALGIIVTILGVAGLILGLSQALPFLGLVGVGLLLFGSGSRWARHLASSYDRIDHLIMLLAALLHLVLALLWIWHWQFSFIGDEWGFFEIARNLNHEVTNLKWFEMRDSNGYHTIFSSQLQAWVMQIFGEHVVTWRLSSILPGVFSTPAIYIVGHWLGGRKTGLVSAVTFAASHALICFAMIPYNNTQALVPIAVGMALFVFAIQRESMLRYLLLGMMLGTGFIVYGLARLAVIPIGIFWLTHQWPNLRSALRRGVEIGIGTFVVAVPVLLNLASWKSLLKATPVESEVAKTSAEVLLQMARNIISGFFAFVSNPSNTHFVIGPYMDPLSALLVLIGVSYALVLIGRRRASSAWLFSALLLLVAMSGIQQYDRISTTRMFSSVIIFAVFAGIGCTALLSNFFAGRERQQYASMGLILLLIVGLNQYHIQQVTLPNAEKPEIPKIIQQFQESSTADGRGMPIFLLQENPYESNIKLVIQAYDFSRDDIVFLTEDEALQLQHLCAVGDEAAMLIMPIDAPKRAEIRERIAQCWPAYTETPLRNRAEETILARFTTALGTAALALPAAERYQNQAPPLTLTYRGIKGVAVAPDGSIFILSREQRKVIHYSSAGQQLHAFSLIQSDPRAIAVYGKDQLIVSGGEDKVVWYDYGGNVMQKSARGSELGHPFDLAVLDNGEVLTGDIERRYIVRISPVGELIETFPIAGIGLPSTLALSVDQQSLWVNDSDMGKLVQISLTDHAILAEIPTLPYGLEESNRVVALPNGDLLETIPSQRRLVQITPTGVVVRIWSGFQWPTDVAVDAMGRILVVDSKLERLHMLSALRQEQPSEQPASPLPVPD